MSELLAHRCRFVSRAHFGFEFGRERQRCRGLALVGCGPIMSVPEMNKALGRSEYSHVSALPEHDQQLPTRGAQCPRAEIANPRESSSQQGRACAPLKYSCDSYVLTAFAPICVLFNSSQTPRPILLSARVWARFHCATHAYLFKSRYAFVALLSVKLEQAKSLESRDLLWSGTKRRM